MAGMRVVVVGCDRDGNIDVADLRAKADAARATPGRADGHLPSTHGVFEEGIRDICAIVHEHGGQVYMDGANMNAQVGLTSPATIGADVCHLNLHKTFCIPHGGGGPGMGPIGVAAHLAPLPARPPAASRMPARRAPASARSRPRPGARRSILPISWAYIAMMGGAGPDPRDRGRDPQRQLHRHAPAPHYPVLYTGRERPRRARVHPRPAAASRQRRHQGRGRRQAADGLRLPRADDVVPGARHA